MIQHSSPVPVCADNPARSRQGIPEMKTDW